MLCVCLDLKHFSKIDIAISKNKLWENIIFLMVNPFPWETAEFQSYWQ